MAPHVIATPKSEVALFSLLIQIQKHLVFLFDDWQNLRCFYDIFILIKVPWCPTYHILLPDWTFCVVNCLPLAYPSTINNHFSSLKPFDRNIKVWPSALTCSKLDAGKWRKCFRLLPKKNSFFFLSYLSLFLSYFFFFFSHTSHFCVRFTHGMARIFFFSSNSS